MTMTMKRFLETTASVVYNEKQPHESLVYGLLELEDGSFVSCSKDTTAKRWLVTSSSDNGHSRDLQHIGTYRGHIKPVLTVAENESKRSIVTASIDGILKVWDIFTCECLDTLQMPSNSNVWVLLKSRKRLSSSSSSPSLPSPLIVCGLRTGVIELRRVGDLALLFSLRPHSFGVMSICELGDGTFVSASLTEGDALKRWDTNGTILTSFQDCSPYFKRAPSVVELRSNLIVTTSGTGHMRFWDATTGKCIHTKENCKTDALLRLSSRFVCVSGDDSVVVLNERGETVVSYPTTVESNPVPVQSMLQLSRDGSIVFANPSRFEIRRYLSLLLLLNLQLLIISWPFIHQVDTWFGGLVL